MFFAVFSVGLQKWFFQFIKNNNKGVRLTDIFYNFMNPDLNEEWPEEYLKFLEDFDKAIRAELFDTREEMIESLKKIYKENNNQVGEPTRLNINFASRLIYLEKKWVGEVLFKHYKKLNKNADEEDYKLAKDLILVGSKERIDLETNNHEVSDIKVNYDLLCKKLNLKKIY